MQFETQQTVLVIEGCPTSKDAQMDFDRWLEGSVYVGEVVMVQGKQLCIRHLENSSLQDDSFVDLRWINLATENVDVTPMDNALSAVPPEHQNTFQASALEISLKSTFA